MIFVQGTIRVGEGDIETIRSVATNMAVKSRAESGCLHYSFAQDLADPNVIHICERWNSEDDLNAHFQMPHMAEFNAAISAITVESADVRMYSGKEERIMLQS